MGHPSYISYLLAFSLIANALCLPTSVLRTKRQSSDSTKPDAAPNDSDNVVNSDRSTVAPLSNDDDDDDDDDAFPTYPQNDSSGGSGSSLFSLLNLVSAFLPGSSSSSVEIQKVFKEIVKRSKANVRILTRRQAATYNEVDSDSSGFHQPPLLRLKNENNIEIENSTSESNESLDETSDSNEQSDENDNEENESNDNSEEFDDDEPPGGGDGEGGGLLGLLAGLSGGEDGQSDLGSLLATISGIIANLSGDGIDLNALIASGIGLFVGLLSEGEENPGEILASYLLTSLDTITGGGANNNGVFFGKFLSKLVKGTSAGGDPDGDSEENGNKMETKDSAGFFLSLLMGLLGDMSKGSSGSQPMRRYFENKPKLLWTLQNDY